MACCIQLELNLYLCRCVLRTLNFSEVVFFCDGKISIETEGASGASLDFALGFLLHQLSVPALQEVSANFSLFEVDNQIHFQGSRSP